MTAFFGVDLGFREATQGIVNEHPASQDACRED